MPRDRARSAPGLPERITLIRARLGLSQSAFAARIGVTRNTVIAYEHGRCTRFRASILRRIAAAGSMTVEDLRHGPTPRWLHDGAWEEAVALLRRVWHEPARRATAMTLLRALGRQ
jgi:transcriptional regulator with XRE-family HTH domain